MKAYTRSRASYFFPSDVDPKEYILSRTGYISRAPQEHFDQFISDILVILDHDILIDNNGKSNFFYDETAGFQLIDLDSHTDYKYGLAKKYDSKEICAYTGFVPCHYALDKKALKKLGKQELQQLSRDNQVIFEKCRAAMLRGGVTEAQWKKSQKTLKIFGQ